MAACNFTLHSQGIVIWHASRGPPNELFDTLPIDEIVVTTAVGPSAARMFIVGFTDALDFLVFHLDWTKVQR